MDSYLFDKEIIKEWEREKSCKYAIPDPNDNLIEIYEIDTIKDAILLRAEKWESFEHQKEKKELEEKKIKASLNTQNPNYTELLDTIRLVQKQSNAYKKDRTDDKKKSLEKAWSSLIAFLEKIMAEYNNIKTVTNEIINIKIIIYKLEFIPDIRLLRYMLGKKEPGLHIEIISLICSYFHAKYINI